MARGPLRSALLVVIFAASAALGCELLVRAVLHIRHPGPKLGPVLMGRLFPLWEREAGSHPFEPPFTVFANRGFEDAARLKRILPYARLPAQGTWLAPDFLLSPRLRERSPYRIRSNSLGFRDPERGVRKPPGAFRVVCLGAYLTFGHGVGDDETYPRQLERLLNARGRGRRFEVWNGGRHAATVIMGLARLRLEIFRYAPDLLILEYGFTDFDIWDDNPRYLPRVGPGDGPAARAYKRAVRLVVGCLVSRSVVLRRLLMGRDDPAMERDFGRVLEELDRLARERGVPVLWVGFEPGTHTAQLERALRGLPGIHRLDVESWLKSHPPAREEVEAFLGRENWTTELLPLGWRVRKREVYNADALHLNALGLGAVARMLVEPVERLARGHPLSSLKGDVDDGQQVGVPGEDQQRPQEHQQQP